MRNAGPDASKLNVPRLLWDFGLGVHDRTRFSCEDYTERARRLNSFKPLMSLMRKHFPGIHERQVNFKFVERGVFDREVERLRHSPFDEEIADRRIFLSRLHAMGIVVDEDYRIEGED